MSNKDNFKPKPVPLKPISVSNSNFTSEGRHGKHIITVTTVLCEDGSVFKHESGDEGWVKLPSLPK